MRLLIAFFCLFSLEVAAQVFTEGISDFDGHLGSEPIRMSLVADSSPEQIVGTYFNKRDLKDISVKGSVHGRDLELIQYGSDGSEQGRFVLQMVEHDPNGRLSGELQGEILIGKWIGSSGGKEVPVHLELDDILSGNKQLAARYPVNKGVSDAELERNAQAFYFAVLKADKDTVSRLIRYPLSANVRGKARTIGERDEFLRNYKFIFTPQYVSCIRSGTPKNMFVHNGAVMLGNGEVWFDGDGHVITLNPCVPR
jgi:hypothetical protein